MVRERPEGIACLDSAETRFLEENGFLTVCSSAIYCAFPTAMNRLTTSQNIFDSVIAPLVTIFGLQQSSDVPWGQKQQK